MRAPSPALHRYPSWLPYVMPMAVFVLMSALEGYAPEASYIWLYFAKVALVTALLLMLRKPLCEIRFETRVLLPGIAVGLLVCLQWIVLDKWLAYPHLGSRVGFNPFEAVADPTWRAFFLCLRFFGLVLLVPIMEEIFWRSFLLRYATDPDFDSLPVGVFSWTALALVSGAFALAHAEWLVAFIAGCAYALLLRQTRSLFACIVAHGTTNLALGIYILRTGDWGYW